MSKRVRLPLVIGNDLWTQISTHLDVALPNEGCGLLAGMRIGEEVHATRFFPGTNIDHSPVRYTMDPVEVIEAMKQMRAQHWDFAAIVHSHPRTRPLPSQTDLREWYYPETRLIIVSFMADEPEIGCWFLKTGSSESTFEPAPFYFTDR